MDKDTIAAFLRNRFDGMDFWTLSKAWKERYYKQVTDLLWQDHQIYRGRIKQLEQELARNGIKLPKYDGSTADDIQWE